MLNVFSNLCLARPHPGPLPQEREEHPTDAGEFERDRFAMCHGVKWNEQAMAQAANETRTSADGFSLSPGERAGVRAGENKNQNGCSFRTCASERHRRRLGGAAGEEEEQREHPTFNIQLPTLKEAAN
jgi:hypothetical protein